MKGFISENSQWCSQGAQRQPQATRKKCNMTKQASTGLTYDRLHLHFCVIWGIKGLIYENAQGWSSGTLEHFEEANFAITFRFQSVILLSIIENHGNLVYHLSILGRFQEYKSFYRISK